MKSYRVIGRGRSTFIFGRGDEISTEYSRDGVAGFIRLSQRYLERGYDTPVPGDLMAVIDVDAANVEDAFTWITSAYELASMISLATNGALLPLEGELVYEITPAKSEREHFQRFVPADQGTYSSRRIPMDATVAFMSAVAHHKERNRIIRAITQYNQALIRWAGGNELLCVSHIFMGAEALKIASLRMHLEELKISKEELADLWGFSPTRDRTIGYFLDQQSRMRLVFHGDALHHDIARSVSDKFEHGLANGGALFKDAREALVPSASHLRRSIIEISGIEECHKNELLGKNFERPRGLGDLEQYFRSTLVGEGDLVGIDGWPHPCWDWKHSIKSVSVDEESWVFSYTPDTKITARIPEGFVFRGGSLEVWDGGQFTPKSAGELKSDDDLAN